MKKNNAYNRTKLFGQKRLLLLLLLFLSEEGWKNALTKEKAKIIKNSSVITRKIPNIPKN